MLNLCKRVAAPGLAAALIAIAPVAVSAAAASQDPAARIDAVIARWEKAQEEFFEAYRAAETNEDRRGLMDERPKAEDYLPEFVALAEEAQGTEPAAKAWIWVLQLAPQARDNEVAVVAVEALMRDHLDSPEIRPLPSMVSGLSRTIGKEKAEGMLREIMKASSGGPVKAEAIYALALLVDGSDPEAGSERAKEVRALMKSLVADYAEVEDSRGRSFGQRAEAWLFEADHLQVGQVAPDIEGNDLSGVAFKLSDYRGKVVLLDFWGNW